MWRECCRKSSVSRKVQPENVVENRTEKKVQPENEVVDFYEKYRTDDNKTKPTMYEKIVDY